MNLPANEIDLPSELSTFLRRVAINLPKQFDLATETSCDHFIEFSRLGHMHVERLRTSRSSFSSTTQAQTTAFEFVPACGETFGALSLLPPRLSELIL
jgi:hypothetical protein